MQWDSLVQGECCSFDQQRRGGFGELDGDDFGDETRIT
jgi:hypothetical protein